MKKTSYAKVQYLKPEIKDVSYFHSMRLNPLHPRSITIIRKTKVDVLEKVMTVDVQCKVPPVSNYS